MSQVTGPLSILDGSATPVAKTFSPERVTPELTMFTERSAPASAGFKRLSIGYSPASAKRATSRIDISLDYPVLSSVGGVSAVAYVARFKGTFVVPDVATAAERSDLISFVANALDNVQVRAVVKDLDPLY